MRIEKFEITSKLAMLKKVIPSKPSIECLRGVLVHNRTMTANNLTTAMQTTIDCDQEETFIIPIQAIAMIESMPDGEIEIKPEGDTQLSISAGAGKIKNRFSTYDPDNFPEWEGVENAQVIDLDGGEMQDAIKTIMYAVANNSPNVAATGMLFEADGENLNLVAMDGYRLAWAKIPYQAEFQMIIPKTSVQILLTLGMNDKVSVEFNRKTAEFHMNDYIFSSRLLDGKFVDYHRVFPKLTNSAIVDRRQALESIKRAMICLDEKNKPLLVTEISGSTMTLKAHSAIGEYTEQLNLGSLADEDVRIGFNARYLVDCLNSYDTDVLECYFGSSTTPMVVDDGNIKSMVLPVRLGGNK